MAVWAAEGCLAYEISSAAGHGRGQVGGPASGDREQAQKSRGSTNSPVDAGRLRSSPDPETLFTLIRAVIAAPSRQLYCRPRLKISFFEILLETNADKTHSAKSAPDMPAPVAEHVM